jgi:hypothetical protein
MSRGQLEPHDAEHSLSAEAGVLCLSGREGGDWENSQ